MGNHLSGEESLMSNLLLRQVRDRVVEKLCTWCGRQNSPVNRRRRIP